MVDTVMMDSDGRVTLPEWVQKFLGVKPGQQIVFRKVNNEVVIEREKGTEKIV